jgi:hypothetical protein
LTKTSDIRNTKARLDVKTVSTHLNWIAQLAISRNQLGLFQIIIGGSLDDDRPFNYPSINIEIGIFERPQQFPVALV